MNKQIILILLILLYISTFSGCSIITGKSVDWRYIYSDDGDHALTIIQYMVYGDSENSVYYVLKGKIKKARNLPQDNYLKFAIDTMPLWIYFKEDGNIEILYGMGNLLENKLQDSTITINRALREKEFEKLTKGKPDRFKVVYFNNLQ
jgi:hypothetical protein